MNLTIRIYKQPSGLGTLELAASVSRHKEKTDDSLFLDYLITDVMKTLLPLLQISIQEKWYQIYIKTDSSKSQWLMPQPGHLI